jgi:hypothetical protein
MLRGGDDERGILLTDLGRVIRESQELADDLEWERSLEVALRGMNYGRECGLDDWVDLRLVLASTASELLRLGKAVAVEPIIAHVGEILDASDPTPRDEQLGLAHLQLGLLYDARPTGAFRDNKAAAVAHWESSSRLLDADAQPDAWAASQECAGVATLEIVNSLLGMREFAMDGVADFSADLAEYALGAFAQAERVYSTGDSGQEKLANVRELMRSAEGMLRELRD